LAIRNLEQLEYTSAVEQRRGALNTKIKEIKAGCSTGFLNSGVLNRRIAEEWQAYCRDLIHLRVQLRRRFGPRDRW